MMEGASVQECNFEAALLLLNYLKTKKTEAEIRDYVNAKTLVCFTQFSCPESLRIVSS